MSFTTHGERGCTCHSRSSKNSNSDCFDGVVVVEIIKGVVMVELAKDDLQLSKKNKKKQ